MIKFFIFLIAIFLFSCQHQSDTSLIVVPENKATQVEQEKLDLALDDIKSLFREYGQNIDWSKIPIVVNESIGSGHCQRGLGGAGEYIVISKIALSQGSVEGCVPSYWHTLLHEIGHCHLSRDHESEILSFDGFKFEFSENSESGRQTFIYDDFPLSVMNNDYYIAIPYSVRKYYVAELSGLIRASKIEDLQRFSDVKLIEK